MTDIPMHENMWFPGPSGAYEGRQGDYAEPVHTFPQERFIELVQTRAKEDGEWLLENSEEAANPAEFRKTVRQMIEWVSRPDNIIQVYESKLEYGPTVDWVCRELAAATQNIVRGMRRG